MGNERIAVFPGTFDPVQYGHISILGDAARMFDKVFWAVLSNSLKKQPMFDVSQRLEMMGMIANKFENVELGSFGGLLVDFARSKGARFVVRSMRTGMDFEFELQMSLANKHVAQEIQTVFLPTHQDHFHLNSTTVRDLILNKKSLNGWTTLEIEKYIQKTRA